MLLLLLPLLLYGSRRKFAVALLLCLPVCNFIFGTWYRIFFVRILLIGCYFIIRVPHLIKRSGPDFLFHQATSKKDEAGGDGKVGELGINLKTHY